MWGRHKKIAIETGSQAPSFHLKNLDGSTVSLDEILAKGEGTSAAGIFQSQLPGLPVDVSICSTAGSIGLPDAGDRNISGRQQCDPRI